MQDLSPLMLLVITWAVFTTILVGLIIYRAVVGIHEEDQLFLNRAGSILEEQVETLKQIRRVDFLLKGFGIVSGALLLGIIAFWLYQGFQSQAPG